MSTCKHIIGLQLILQKYLSADFKIFEPVGSQVLLEESDCMEVNIEEFDALEENTPSAIQVFHSLEEERRHQLLQLQTRMSEVWLTLQSSLVDVSIEEWKHKMELSNRFIESMKQPFTFDRPAMVDLPSKGSISIIQANVKRTRMGFGSKARCIEKEIENTKDTSKDGSTAERPPLKRQGHTLVSTSKSKRAIFPRVPKVICQVCMTRTMVEKGDVSVNCRNCDSDLIVKQT